METRQSIKNRIKSIEGTQQITRSMRLVSVAKMQRAREAMEQNRPFLDESRRLVSVAAGCMGWGEKHPYISGRPVRCTLMLVISGDRGLCGGYNAGVIRLATTEMEALGHPAKMVCIGAKAEDTFRRRKAFPQVGAYRGMSDAPIYAEAAEIAELIRGLYDAGEVDQVLLCHTQFFSMLAQAPAVVRLLPLEGQATGASATMPSAMQALTSYEPAGAAMLDGLVPFYLASRIYGAILESAVCEQSARILSMDNASRTAGDMIQSLNLLYNKARQSVITQEIIEIVAGADACEVL